MALLFFDGFDHYSNYAQKGWVVTGTTTSSSTSAARNGTRGATFGGSNRGMYQSVTSADEYYIGFAYQSSDIVSVSRMIAMMTNGGTRQGELVTDTAGHLRIQRNGTTLDTGTTVLANDTWYYIEWRLKVADASGRSVVRINGVTEIDFTGDTNNSGSVITRVGIAAMDGSGTVGANPFWDDLYIGDASASFTYLGDVRAATLYPNGAGNSTQWTPSAGSNFQTVDEAVPNDDTDYNSDATAGHIDSFTMDNMPTVPTTVHGVQQLTRHRKDDAGARTLRQVIRRSSTNYESGDISVLDTYSTTRRLLLTDPSTSSAWTQSGVDAMESGYKMQA